MDLKKEDVPLTSGGFQDLLVSNRFAKTINVFIYEFGYI